jgi:enoyl-CoA hydratase
VTRNGKEASVERCCSDRLVTTSDKEYAMKYDLPSEVMVEEDGPVRIVTLNRPESFNSVNEGLHRGIATVWRQIGADPEARAAVLTGAGPAFCAGGDMTWFGAVQDDAELRAAVIKQAKEVVHELVRFPLPLVGAVNGAAVGLGCSLAVLCDIVLMADNAFLADPHVAVGLVAGDGGVVTWPLFMSLLKAKEYLFTGDKINAETAERLGLANRVVPAADLRDEALTLAHRLAGLPAKALQDTKRALNLHLQQAVTLVLDFALAAESECFTLPEHRERVEAFLARTGNNP